MAAAKRLIHAMVPPSAVYVMRRIEGALAKHSIKPCSRKFGEDRGTPIDRYYIERFLQQRLRGGILLLGKHKGSDVGQAVGCFGMLLAECCAVNAKRFFH